ncbi:MAG: rRNA maturation RNase YbeY [Elusimicrobia bacterium]|nr:rRNA maturation RNase YbeY [Elusimicrobiota bacterium]
MSGKSATEATHTASRGSGCAKRAQSTLVVRVAGAGRLPPSARKPRLIAQACRRALRSRPRKPGLALRGEVNIVFLDSRAMRSLNKRFHGRDRDTDVLAFPYDAPFGRPAQRPFGDIFVCADRAKAQARELGHTTLAEAIILVAHGALHLLGHDDDSPRRRAAMDRLQAGVWRSLGRP